MPSLGRAKAQPLEIPQQPAELSSRWLTDQLRATKTIEPAAEVREFDYQLPAGNAMSGVTIRLKLTYDQDRPGQPATLIAKFAAADPTVKGMLEASDTYGREIAFYQDLQAKIPIPTPRYCGGGCDPAPGGAILQKLQRFYDKAPARMHGFTARRPELVLRASKRRYALLLEDVGENAIVHDLTEPPNAAQLEPVIAQLATLHAHFWGQSALAAHPAIQPPLGQLPNFFKNALRLLCRDLANERFASWLTPAHHQVYDDIHDYALDDVAIVQRPVTLLHGDPRSDNLLYFGDDPVFVDWALAAYANPAFDIAYLLTAALPGKDIADIERLVRSYLAQLAELGHELDFDIFWSEMRACSRAIGLQMTLGLATPMPYYGEQHPAELWMPRILDFLVHSA